MFNVNWSLCGKMARRFALCREEIWQTAYVSVVIGALAFLVAAAVTARRAVDQAVERAGREPQFTRMVLAVKDAAAAPLTPADLDRLSASGGAKAAVPWLTLPVALVDAGGNPRQTYVRSTIRADPDLRRPARAGRSAGIVLTDRLAQDLGLVATAEGPAPTVVRVMLRRMLIDGTNEERQMTLPLAVVPAETVTDPLHQAFAPLGLLAQMRAWCAFADAVGRQPSLTVDRAVIHAVGPHDVRRLDATLRAEFEPKGFTVVSSMATLDQFERVSAAVAAVTGGATAVVATVGVLVLAAAGHAVGKRAAPAIAELRLAGATPLFLRGWLAMHLGGTAAAGLSVGCVAAAVAAPPLLGRTIAAFGDQFAESVTLAPVGMAWTFAIGLLLAVAAALIGSWRSVTNA